MALSSVEARGIFVVRLFKWLGVALGGSLALLLLTGAVWERVERRQVAAAYPAAGRLVDIGGRRMQIECRGAGRPTVVFETGLDYFGALAWAKVLGPVAQFTRACAYSRAGIVWSDDKPGRHDGLGAARDLHATLAAAGEHGPFVLVGLSMGGPLISIYTGTYGDEVAGLVYVDASHPDQLRRFEAALGKPAGGGMAAVVQDLGGTMSWTGAPRLVAMAARDSHGETLAAMPPRTKEVGLAYFATSLGAMAAERDALPATFAEAGAYRDLGARPVVVLTRGKPAPAGELSTAAAAKWDAAWRVMQQDMATWSTRATQRTVSDAGHYIPNDDPAAVIGAVREVVDAVRGRVPFP